MKYGTISEKYLGPKECPPHQFGKEEVVTQCKRMILSKKQSNVSNFLSFIFNMIPYSEKTKIAEKTNNPRDGLIKFPAKAQKKSGSKRRNLHNL
jgi:hypothetical protein